MADTGWVIAGTGSNDTGVGTEAWVSPGNVTADDATYTEGAPAKNEQMNYIKGSNFGLSVPTGATIDGIEIRGQFYDANSGSECAAITHALVVHPSSGNGTDQEAGETVLTATPTNYDYGGASNLHGKTWTASDVNNSSFAVMFSCNAKIFVVVAGDPRCDAIWVKVHYTPASGGAFAWGQII